MKFIKLDLLTLLISLFLFASCERTSTIGLEVDPTNEIQGNLIDTATISSRTVKEDAGNTSALARYPFGFLNDAALGSTTSNLALSINVPSDAYSFGTNAVLDSAVLVLNYAGEFYGDSTATYNVDVHQLNNNLAKENTFLSNRTYPFNSSVIANYTGKVFPTTPIKVTDVLTGAKDTIKTNTPQLRLKLSNSFITTNIVSLTATDLKYNSYFQDKFKGLYVQVKPSAQSTMGTGGVMFFNFASSAGSGLMLYYRKQNATTTTLTDTVSVNFPISTSTSPLGASVSHTYSTQVQAQLDALVTNPKQQFPTTYLKPLGGLRTKLSFPYLKKMKTEVGGKMIVNKAELIVDLSSGTEVAPFRAAPRIALYRTDIAGQRKNLPDNDAGDGVTTAGDPRANPSAFGGYFDSTKKRYVFVVTAYLQDLLDGKTEDYGTYLAVTPTAAFEYLPSFGAASRAIIGSFQKSPAAGANLIKLNIYYTKAN